MTIDTRRTEERAPDAIPAVLAKQGELPGWAPGAILVGSLAVVGAVLAATGFSVGLWVFLSAVVFAVATYAISRGVEGARRATDRLVTVLVTTAFLLALIPLISVIIVVVKNGLARFDVAFFTESMRGVVGAGGGGYHAIMGTLIITALAAVISIPIGLLTAIYLVEYGRSRLSQSITFFVDVMTGIPSIVAGLFAFALFSLFAGPSFRFGFMGAVALSVLMIPVVVRSTEEMLKIVPNELREAAYALGTPKWRTIVKVVLRTAIAGITSGVTLAIARVIGETAPLLLTVGLTAGVNLNPFSNRMATLPVFAFNSYSAPGVPREPFIDRAWTAALVLMIIVLLLNLVARIVARVFAPKTR